MPKFAKSFEISKEEGGQATVLVDGAEFPYFIAPTVKSETTEGIHTVWVGLLVEGAPVFKVGATPPPQPITWETAHQIFQWVQDNYGKAGK